MHGESKKTGSQLFSVSYRDDRKVYELIGIKFKIRRPRFKHIRFKFSPTQGIGNRIKPIIAALYYDNPEAISIFWPVKGWVSAKFAELFMFDYDGVLLEYDESSAMDFRQWIEEPSHTLKLKNRFAPLLEADRIDFRFNGIKPELLRDYAALFSKLTPTCKVKNRIAQVHLPDGCVCVHIRNNSDWGAFGRNEDLGKFVSAMNRCPADTIFFLSAMNRAVADFMRGVFPGRILELPEKNYCSMIDATADLYILGSAQKAIFSFGSTFCELAWWLGGAKAEVVLVGSDAAWR